MLLSGVAGFLVGLAFDDWQVVVETAQVLAGLVSYPHDNPFFIYHVKVWSILHQICALLLRLGVSEAALSVAISGLLGMLSFQALALVIFAVGGDALVAVGAVFVLFVTRAAEYGVVYPIWLVGTIHTYGLFGLAWCVVSLGLLGCGRTRSGALMLGMSPAVHPSIGVWFGATAAVAVLWGRRDLGPELRRGLIAFAIGAGITAASLLVRLWLTPAIAAVDPGVARDLITAFISFWDGHRRPVDPSSEGLGLNAGAVLLSMVWLAWFPAHLTASSRLLLRFTAVAGVAGGAIAVASQVPIDRLPIWFVVLMPSRLLNLNAMIFAAMLFGVLGVYRRERYGQAGLLVLALGLMCSRRAMDWEWLPAIGISRPFRGVDQLSVMVVAAVLAVLAAVSRTRRGSDADGRAAAAEPDAAARLVRWSFAALGVVAAGLTFAAGSARREQPGTGVYRDRAHDVVFAAARRQPGMLLTGGDMQLIQLRTRRPVLIDGGGLDGLVYAPESTPAVDRVLRDVYGIDVRHPPDEARHGGRVPVNANRAVWEAYTPERWQEIARTYGITQVMTHAHWQLELPLVARSPGLALYAIPK
jgi:hypothetical protein